MRKGVNESNAQFYLRRQPKKVAHTKWIKLVQETIPLPDSALSSVPYVCRHTVISSLQCMPRGALPHKSIHTNPGRLKPQIPRIKKTKLNITKQAKKKKTLWEVVWVAKPKAEIKWKGMISFISISFLNETVS